MNSTSFRRPARGMALLPIILLVAFLSAVAAFAMKVSGTERAQAGKSVHNVSMQTMADTTLQLGRNFFAAQYQQWGTYLSYFVDHPVQLASRADMSTYVTKLRGDHPELFVKLPDYLADTFDCFMYAQDNVDEFAPATNKPRIDNDLLIYVGAVCAQKTQGGSTQTNQIIAELTAPLLYAPPNTIGSQASGGSQGNNNDSQMNTFR
ncbi:MAG: hypothetical protein ACJ79G_13195 [Myxococcales bacterium]